MVEHTRVWKAGDGLENVLGFKFSVQDTEGVIAAAQQNFVESQAQAWRDIRQWADDAIQAVETEPGGSPNGPGASLSLTENLREQLPQLWARHAIMSVLDVACGDWNWMRYVDMSGLRTYVGWDIDTELIVRCQQRVMEEMGLGHRAASTSFEVNNVTETPFPEVDCILARHILIHFPNDYISDIIERMRVGNSDYLLTSNFPEATNDFIYDPTKYAWAGYMERPVNLELPPFSLSNKVDAITEQIGPAGVLAYPHELALFKL